MQQPPAAHSPSPNYAKVALVAAAPDKVKIAVPVDEPPTATFASAFLISYCLILKFSISIFSKITLNFFGVLANSLIRYSTDHTNFTAFFTLFIKGIVLSFKVLVNSS